MAADFLANVIRMNIAASAAIILVLALRKLTRRGFGARVAYSLWLVVPLAMAASLLPARTHVLERPMADAVAAGRAGQDALPIELLDFSVPLLGLWVMGMMASVSVLAWRQQRFAASLGGVVWDGQYLRAKANDGGPVVVGILRPHIILPTNFEARYEPAEQDVILAHEIAHVRAGDTRVNAVVAALQCLAWFNPLMHIAAHAVRLDQELACDAAVLAARPGDRRLYAEALLKGQFNNQALPLGCYWPTGANPLKERILMLKSKSPSKGRAAAGAMLVACVGISAGAAAWAAQPARAVVASLESQTAPSATIHDSSSQALNVTQMKLRPPGVTETTVASPETSSAEDKAATAGPPSAPAPGLTTTDRTQVSGAYALAFLDRQISVEPEGELRAALIRSRDELVANTKARQP